MREIDPVPLIKPGTRLDQLLADLISPAQPARQVPGSTRVEVECFGAKRRPTRYLQRLNDQDRQLTSGFYGRVMVRRHRYTRSRAERHYWVRCDCGREAWLTAWQIFRRRQLDLGCLQPGCTEAPEHLRPWYDPLYALRLQHWQLLQTHAHLVDNDWGGVLAETVPPALEADGLRAFLECASPKVNMTERAWWVQRDNPLAAFTPDNLVLSKTPDQELMQSLLALYIDDLEAGVLPDAPADHLMEHPTGETPMTEQKVTVVRPEDPDYDKFTQMVTGPDAPSVRRFDYDAFAMEYNRAPKGSFLVMLQTFSTKTSNIHHVLSNRGIAREVDYHLERPTRDTSNNPLPKDKRNVVIQKLSDHRLALKRDL